MTNEQIIAGSRVIGATDAELWRIVNRAPERRALWVPIETAAELELERREEIRRRPCPGLPGHPAGVCPNPAEHGDRYCAGCRAEYDAAEYRDGHDYNEGRHIDAGTGA